MKTIILCWRQKCNSMKQTDVHNFWGLGDLIRGTIATFQLCKKHGYKLIVDTHAHPISVFFKNSRTEYSDLIDELGENIQFKCPGEVENFILNQRRMKSDPADLDSSWSMTDKDFNSNEESPIVFMTNEQCIEPIEEDVKDFIRELISPNNDIINDINQIIQSLPCDYIVKHVRLGDAEMVRNQQNTNKYMYLLNRLISMRTSKDVLFSDSYNFKKFASSRAGFISLNTETSHLGYHTDLNKLKNTMIDFYLISKSKMIYSYSEYSWNSGFVYWSSVIYNIPFRRVA